MIESDPASVWKAVRDVGAVHRRLVPGQVVDTRLDGDIRILTFHNGASVRELIVDIDDETRRLAYAVVESRLPITRHHASFQVFDEGPDRTRLVWITDILPHTLAGEIRARVERGAEIMKQTLEARSEYVCGESGRELPPG